MRVYIRLKTKEQQKAVMKWESAMDPVLILDHELVTESGSNALSDEAGHFIALPDTSRQKDIEYVRRMMETAQGKMGIMIKTLDQLEMAAEMELKGPVIADSSLYAYNRESFLFYDEAVPGMMFVCADELSDPELAEMVKTNVRKRDDGSADLCGRMIYKVYGHQALMITEQCIGKNHGRCGTDIIEFQNSKGDVFYSKSSCGQCYSIIYDKRVTWLFDRAGKVPFNNYLIDFTVENYEQTASIMEAAARIFSMTDGRDLHSISAAGFKCTKGCRVNSVE